ncbi:NUDIX hydrolase [Solicola sp. PLA-1-18]|uniref:NUDIX hydrolase n=1 Tax=Solicola sp. PLA-1-18 TaxID=3380532 RepID=UPI003B7A3E23
MSVEPSVLAGLPDWLHPLAEGVSEVEDLHLSPRLPSPPADARQSAVLMLFGEGERGPDLLFTERSARMRSHAGQVSFPGGRRDPGDVDEAATALREAQEEVGLDPAAVHVFGDLPPLWLPPSNSAVTVVLGYAPSSTPVHIASPAEVASVFRTPLADLLDPERRFTVRGPSGWRGPGFRVGDGLTLWGFTAGVVARLFSHVGWEREWDQSRLEPYPRPPAGARQENQ